jgi:hypothetical protein
VAWWTTLDRVVLDGTTGLRHLRAWCATTSGRAARAAPARRCAGPSSCRRPVARGLDDPGDRSAGEQQHRGDEEEDGQDVDAEAADQAPDDALEQAADLAAVGLPQPQAGRQQQAQGRRRETARTAGSTGRRTSSAPIAASAGGTALVMSPSSHSRPSTARRPGLAAIAVAVDDEAEEDGHGDQAEPDEVEVALLELEAGAGPCPSPWPCGRSGARGRRRWACGSQRACGARRRTSSWRA